MLKTVAAEYEIIYQDKTNNANIFIKQDELFKLLVSYKIWWVDCCYLEPLKKI